jgi:hypothetical protein
LSNLSSSGATQIVVYTRTRSLGRKVSGSSSFRGFQSIGYRMHAPCFYVPSCIVILFSTEIKKYISSFPHPGFIIVFQNDVGESKICRRSKTACTLHSKLDFKIFLHETCQLGVSDGFCQYTSWYIYGVSMSLKKKLYRLYITALLVLTL